MQLCAIEYPVRRCAIDDGIAFFESVRLTLAQWTWHCRGHSDCENDEHAGLMCRFRFHIKRENMVWLHPPCIDDITQAVLIREIADQEEMCDHRESTNSSPSPTYIFQIGKNEASLWNHNRCHTQRLPTNCRNVAHSKKSWQAAASFSAWDILRNTPISASEKTHISVRP